RQVDRDDLPAAGPGEELAGRRPGARSGRGDRLDVAVLDVALELRERPAVADGERRRGHDRRCTGGGGDDEADRDGADEEREQSAGGGRARATAGRRDPPRWKAATRASEAAQTFHRHPGEGNGSNHPVTGLARIF